MNQIELIKKGKQSKSPLNYQSTRNLRANSPNLKVQIRSKSPPAASKSPISSVRPRDSFIKKSKLKHLAE